MGKTIKLAIAASALALGLMACTQPISEAAAQAGDICSYSDWAWNSTEGRAENYQEIVTTRSSLTAEQKHDIYPCTICREDQVEIKIDGVDPILMCTAFAQDVQAILERAQDDGFEINALVGYRVGRTRGPLDDNGLRTGYSNHSFGVAIDINPDQNGLYNHCIEFSDQCRLSRGGPWIPYSPGAITPDLPLHHDLRDLGLLWGGELAGQQKDFMHFSPSGG